MLSECLGKSSVSESLEGHVEKSFGTQKIRLVCCHCGKGNGDVCCRNEFLFFLALVVENEKIDICNGVLISFLFAMVEQKERLVFVMWIYSYFCLISVMFLCTNNSRTLTENTDPCARNLTRVYLK